MNKITIMVAFIFGICNSYGFTESESKVNDFRLPSYRMLNFSFSKVEVKYNKKLISLLVLPKTPKDFFELQKKANKGDAASNYLLFFLYYDDSNCSEKSTVLRKEPHENCFIALDYLNKSVEINPKFEAGLYKLAYFNQQGIGMTVDVKKSANYYQQVVILEGSYRHIAMRELSNMYLYDFQQTDKAKYYINLCAKEGDELCKFMDSSWDRTLKYLPYIIKAKERERQSKSQ